MKKIYFFGEDMPRPKRTRKDANHAEIRQRLRSDGFTVIDVADLPGDPRHNPLDLFVIRQTSSPPVIVATSAEGVRRWFDAHPYTMVVQVEVKPDYGAPLTKDEEAYFEALGVPVEYWV